MAESRIFDGSSWITITDEEHRNASDPHPQYLTTGRGDARYPRETDPRLTDARTPTAHAATHAAAGSDPVTLTSAQISDLTETVQDVGITAVSAAHSLVLADAHKAVEVDSATPVSVTVPLNATVAFPIGTLVEVYQRGAGQVSIAATGGVTIESRGALVALTGQYAVASLRKRATDTWVLTGDLA